MKITSSSKAALFHHNRTMLVFSLTGMCFKVLAGLSFSSFTRRILDTISGEISFYLPALIGYALFTITCLIFGALLE